jgi:hypothetical protein
VSNFNDERPLLTESERFLSNPPLTSMPALRNRASFMGFGSTPDIPGSPDRGSGKLHLPENIGSLKDEDKELHGLHLLGDFTAGDFFGHAALMKDVPHEHSIVATSACTVFVLEKAVIYKMIHSEPVVGLKLQEALGLAISAQAESLGQSHRRHNRAEFLR